MFGYCGYGLCTVKYLPRASVGGVGGRAGILLNMTIQIKRTYEYVIEIGERRCGRGQRSSGR